MNKRGELKLFNGTSKVISKPLSKELDSKITLDMLAEMKAHSGKVITAFYLHCKNMLEKNYDLSWSYGKLYPFNELMQDITAHVQSIIKSECRLLLEGKIISLNSGFVKSAFPEFPASLHFRPGFKTLSFELLKGRHLTDWLTPGDEPEGVTIYIIPAIHLSQGKPIYFVVGEDGTGKYTGGGFAEKLMDTIGLVTELTSDLLRKKMIHAVPNSRPTPVTAVNLKVQLKSVR
ncbi:hypothetical protein HZC30_03045 [Candidatus Woesearchaeota archaeon]|nr:hypothetical protein [Candidatus Woesearchaeota archaeon]